MIICFLNIIFIIFYFILFKSNNKNNNEFKYKWIGYFKLIKLRFVSYYTILYYNKVIDGSPTNLKIFTHIPEEKLFNYIN